MDLPQNQKEKDYTFKQLTKLLSDRWWRLNNLYHVKDEDGNKVVFKPENRRVQKIIHDNMWNRTIVPKARQHGVTTFFTILYLDQVLWHKNQTAGIIAHTEDDMKKIFRNKIRFAWKHMPEWVREYIHTTKKTTTEMEFDNGSSIFVDLSTRSGTVQYLHISEFGYICKNAPKKADEIVRGGINSVHGENIISIESTAHGSEGYFADYCQRAKELQKSSEPLTKQDWRLFFFGWHEKPSYRLDADITIPKEKNKYFDKIENKLGITIDDEQRKWYIKKEENMQQGMREEFPSTLEECFEVNTEGAYYSRQMEKAYDQDRITELVPESHLKVNTYWDIGMNDFTVVLLVQEKGEKVRFIDMIWDSGEPMSYYATQLDEMRKENDYRYGRHYVPHDAAKRSVESGDSTADILRDEGVRPLKVCDRTSVQAGIEKVRKLFRKFYIDTKNCSRLVEALRSYRKEWNDRRGVWKNKPLHDEHSHFADAVRLLAMEYRGGQDDQRWSLNQDGANMDGKREQAFFG